MTAPVVMYGLKNCDTIRKARSWLEAHDVDYQFHDYKSQGVDAAHLEKWMEVVGWETLLNRAGTTFRKLPEDQKTGLDAAKALALMLAQPSMIKRPVLEAGSVIVGFKPELYAKAFAAC